MGIYMNGDLALSIFPELPRSAYMDILSSIDQVAGVVTGDGKHFWLKVHSIP